MCLMYEKNDKKPTKMNHDHVVTVNIREWQKLIILWHDKLYVTTAKMRRISMHLYAAKSHEDYVEYSTEQKCDKMDVTKTCLDIKQIYTTVWRKWINWCKRKNGKMIHEHGRLTDQSGQSDDTKHKCDNIIWPRKSHENQRTMKKRITPNWRSD